MNQSITISVFHLMITEKARENPEVQAHYFSLITGFGNAGGQAAAAKSVLDGEWEDKGLSYVKVAEVDGEDLDEAYASTNHHRGSWLDNPNVKPCFDTGSKFRSTSVGDVMAIGTDVSIVAPHGFTQIDMDAQEDVSPNGNRPRS